MITPKLDPAFRPMILALREYERAVAKSAEKTTVTLIAERNGGYNYIYSYEAFADGTGNDEWNFRIAERLAKTVLWVVGGFKITVAGSKKIFEGLQKAYTRSGARDFDVDFMSGVYERPFVVEYLAEGEPIPAPKNCSLQVGGHLDGCRIGFDAGGSDRKVSAVIDGEVVYSEEVVWHPKTATDPSYHYDEILKAMQTAASKMPRVDAIGVSSAGVYIDNRAMVSSLFLKVDKALYGDCVKNMYLNVAKEMGAPIEVANDGDVTALAGSIDLGDNCVLGIAMGTSEAVGYINAAGGINGWLSELAFVPVDMNENAMRDEWSGDVGVGCKYFSQDAVIKLATYGGFSFDEKMTPAEKLKVIQGLAEAGDPLAEDVFRDIGIYLAYTLPFYQKFYDMRHLLLLGRVMGGRGGDLILASCRKTLAAEFPETAGLDIILPDEKNRRVGQSIAAASLPQTNK